MGSPSVMADPGMTDGALSTSTQSRNIQPYNRVVDSVLRAIRTQALDARYDIKVTDLGEVVLLEGEVDSGRSKEQLIEAASSTSGKRVRDELRIRQAPSDTQIAENVRSALRSDCPQLASRINVDVRGGVALLSGDLRNHREVDDLLATALMVEGVRDIKSDITLGGRPYATRRINESAF